MYNTNYFNNNRYNPYYTPYVPYQQMMPQQMQQPIQQPAPQPVEIPISNIRFLNEKEMAGYVMPVPNTKEMLIDKENKTVCIKSTDQIGQSRAKYYKFDEIVGGAKETQNKGKTEPENDMSVYATKQDVKSLTNLISEMADKLTNLEGKTGGKSNPTNK